MKRKALQKIISTTLSVSVGLSTMMSIHQPILANKRKEIDYTDGSPWVDSNIDGVVTADTQTNLKDDFYLAVNKDEILNLQFVDGDEKVSKTFSMEHTISKNVHDLIVKDNPQTKEEKILHSYYLALKDWDTRSKLAKERVKEHLEKIDNLKNVKDYCENLYDWKADNAFKGLFSVGLAPTEEDASITGARIIIQSFILGDASEYEEKSDFGQLDFDFNLELYRYALDVMGLDSSQADHEFEAMIAFETKLAQHAMTAEEMTGADSVSQTYNYFSIDEIDEMLGSNIRFREMLEQNHFVPADKIKVSEPNLLSFIGTVLNDNAFLDEIKNWEKVRYIISMVEEYSKEANEHYQEIQANTFGVEIKSKEQQIIEAVGAELDDVTQIAYVNKYANKEMKSQIEKLCEDIIAEYKKMLSDCDWIEEQTKKAALEKLEHMKIHAVYPDKFPDISALDIIGMNYYEAKQVIWENNVDQKIKQLNQKMDSDIWLSTPLDTNAFYSPEQNTITICLGILGENTFTVDMKTEEIYGRIGSIIGHEISHAFDSKGSQFDQEGNFKDWWTKKDKKKFDEKIEKVRSYFNGISIYGDKKLDGKILDGEATADITSIECLLRIAKGTPDFDYDLFFRSYADFWAMKETANSADEDYMYDTHPPMYLRVNATVQQFDEFLDTYDVTKGDEMYLALKDRIVVW